MKNIENYTSAELIEIVRDFGTTDMVRTAAAGELAIRALQRSSNVVVNNASV